jgi:hypothetical protein
MCVRWCRNRRGIYHLGEFIERFRGLRAEFSANSAASERIDVIHCRELGRRKFRIQPRMVAPNVTNPDNSNA